MFSVFFSQRRRRLRSGLEKTTVFFAFALSACGQLDLSITDLSSDGALTVELASLQSGMTSLSPFSVTVSFSKPVVGLSSGDFSLTNATIGNLSEVTPGLKWQLELTPTAAGTATILIPAGQVSSSSGDKNLAKASFSIEYSPLGGGGIDLDELPIDPSAGTANDRFGESIAIFGTTLAIGSPGDADNGEDSGSVYLFEYNPQTASWLETKIVPSDGSAGDEFGASVSLFGTTLVVGAAKDDPSGSSSGSVYIYQFDEPTDSWLETKLVASDGASGDLFGSSVSISGHRLAVGATNDDGQGSVYVYHYNYQTNLWQEQKLTASDGSSGDGFGTSVAIDIATLVVGAPQDDDNGSDSGSAYVFRFNPQTHAWVEDKQVASDGNAGAHFGASVSLSGTTFVIGAPQDDDQGESSGSAYVYRFNSQSNDWHETKILPGDGVTGDQFGASTAVYSTTVVVGAPLANAMGADSGKAYIYGFSPVSTSWVEERVASTQTSSSSQFGGSVGVFGNVVFVGASHHADAMGSSYLYKINDFTAETKFLASDGAATHEFGDRVAISGYTAVVTSPQDNFASGAVYVYQYDSPTQAWIETKITASDSTGSTEFGSSADVYGDKIVVGRWYGNANGFGAGSVYIYEYNPVTSLWDETKLLASDGASGDHLGEKVSITGTIVGAGSRPNDNGGFSNSGSVYVFEYNPSNDTWEETKLVASGASNGTSLGADVALSGTTLVAGAIGGYGSAYIYHYNPQTNQWEEEVILTASDGTSGDRFGNNVGISGSLIAVANLLDTHSGLANAGSVYAYRFSPQLDSWVETKLIASDAVAGAQLGKSVDVSGTTIAVTAYRDDDNGFESGSLYIYRFNPQSNTWFESKITPSDGAPSDWFGGDVAVSGTNVIVGSKLDDDLGSESGSAYLYGF